MNRGQRFGIPAVPRWMRGTSACNKRALEARLIEVDFHSPFISALWYPELLTGKTSLANCGSRASPPPSSFLVIELRPPLEGRGKGR